MIIIMIKIIVIIIIIANKIIIIIIVITIPVTTKSCQAIKKYPAMSVTWLGNSHVHVSHLTQFLGKQEAQPLPGYSHVQQMEVSKLANPRLHTIYRELPHCSDMSALFLNLPQRRLHACRILPIVLFLLTCCLFSSSGEILLPSFRRWHAMHLPTRCIFVLW